MPARFRARDRGGAPPGAADRSCRPGPRKTRSRSTDVVRSRPRTRRREGRGTRRRACAAPDRPSSLDRREDLGAALRRQGRDAVAHELACAAGEQDSGAPFAKTASRRLARVGVHRAHQLSLGREGHLADARESRVEPAPRRGPTFRAATSKRALRRVALDVPSPSRSSQRRRCSPGCRRASVRSTSRHSRPVERPPAARETRPSARNRDP